MAPSANGTPAIATNAPDEPAANHSAAVGQSADNDAVLDHVVDHRHAGVVREIDPMLTAHHREVGASTDAEVSDVVATQRARAAFGRGEEGFIDGEAVLAARQRDDEWHRGRVAR